MPGTTVEPWLGPVGLGHRNQLGLIQALAGAFADDGGGGVLVAVAGGSRDRQPQPMPAGQRRRGWLAWGAGPVGVMGWFDRQMLLEARQRALSAGFCLGPGSGHPA